MVSKVRIAHCIVAMHLPVSLSVLFSSFGCWQAGIVGLRALFTTRGIVVPAAACRLAAPKSTSLMAHMTVS